jgi:hypothetical protein
MAIVRRLNVRYAIFHLDTYPADAREPLMARLIEFAPHLRRLYADKTTMLFEIVGTTDGR